MAKSIQPLDCCTKARCYKNHQCKEFYCVHQKVMMDFDLNNSGRTYPTKMADYNYDGQIIHKMVSLNKTL